MANPQFTFLYFGALTLTDTTSLNVVLIPVQNLPASLGDTESTTLTTGLNIFLGAGDITISADSVLIDPGVDTALSGDVNGFSNMSFLSGTLTYNYTPAEAAVPEPATLTLLGFGLAGMGARRWRQRKP